MGQFITTAVRTGGPQPKRLGITPARFPRDHQGFATDPGPFAETVHNALHGS